MTVQWTGPAWLRRPAESLGLEKIYLRATDLTLQGRKYDDRTIKHLVKLNRLESLTLSSAKFSGDGIAQLRNALPECRIEVY